MRFRRRSLRADLPFLCPVPGMTSFFDGRSRSHGGGSSAWEVLGGLPGSPGKRLGRWTIHRYGDRTAGGGRRRHHRPWRVRGGLPVVFPAGVPVHRQARRLGACRGPGGRDVRGRLPVPGLFRPGARLAAFVAVRDRGEPGPQPDRMHIKSGAADPASAPGSALGRPARRTPGHTPCWARRSRSLNVTLGWYSAQPSSSACRYNSRPPRQGRLRAFGRDRLSPT